ncbi:MAG: hypothetical protein JWM93_3975 [Frankiales bacterium]|nr:hypothetical protein [Frankiales bacterium]
MDVRSEQSTVLTITLTQREAREVVADFMSTFQQRVRLEAELEPNGPTTVGPRRLSEGGRVLFSALVEAAGMDKQDDGDDHGEQPVNNFFVRS